jgi:hypothetical protein
MRDPHASGSSVFSDLEYARARWQQRENLAQFRRAYGLQRI